jgi:hypothetical protein
MDIMSKAFDRTPSDVAYVKLHAHLDSTTEVDVLPQEYATMTSASAHAKKLLKYTPWYRIDLFGYKADGSLWHHLPLYQHMKGKAGMRKAVTS